MGGDELETLETIEAKLRSIYYEFEADGKFTKFKYICNNLKQLRTNNNNLHYLN